MTPARRSWLIGRVRSVRARTTLAATAIVAVVLVGAVAGLTYTVERALVGRVRAQAEAQVGAVADQLATGASASVALASTRAADVVAGELPTYVAVLDDEGHPVVGDGFFTMPGVVVTEVTVALSGDERVVRVGSSDLAIAQRQVVSDGRLLLIVAASPLATVVRSVGTITDTAMVGVPLLVALVGAVTWRATGRTLRPIDRIRREVEELSSRSLGRRVPVPDSDDEVALLAQTMNRMLERLEAASEHQRRFVSDASHELRSPVAAIRAELEVALAHPDTGTWHDVATGVLSETTRIEQIVEDLLLLARLDERCAPPTGTVDVAHLVRDHAAHVRGAEVAVDMPERLLVRGSDGELASVTRNLLDNAARHAAGRVAIAGSEAAGAVLLTVDDDGPGIPPADRQRVFERFTRLEHARSRAGGGVGLGLAVVDRIVRHHGGTVAVTDSPMGGARFEVTLPAP